jgi:hypothetical protein
MKPTHKDRQIEKVAKQLHTAGWRAGMKALNRQGSGCVLRSWDGHMPHIKEAWMGVARWHLKQMKPILAEALEALQDALVCLDGERYTGGTIYDEEPYVMQKRAVRKILLL